MRRDKRVMRGDNINIQNNKYMKILKQFKSNDLEVLLTTDTMIGSTFYAIVERIKNGKRTQNETGKKYTIREVAHTRHWEEGEELFKKEVLKYLI